MALLKYQKYNHSINNESRLISNSSSSSLVSNTNRYLSTSLVLVENINITRRFLKNDETAILTNSIIYNSGKRLVHNYYYFILFN